AAEKGEHLRLRGLRGIARGDWTEGSLHDECNLAATMQADIDVSQPLRHLSSGIELMCVNNVERSWGRAYRAFALPSDIDGNRTEARYDKGVLTLTLPKRVNGNARRITVS